MIPLKEPTSHYDSASFLRLPQDPAASAADSFFFKFSLAIVPPFCGELVTGLQHPTSGAAKLKPDPLNP